MTDWQATRNHYLGMAALGLALAGLVALVNPGIAAVVALPAVFFAAQSAGAKFVALSGRTMAGSEAMRLASLAAALQVAVGASGIAVAIAATYAQTRSIHYDRILAVLAGAGFLSLVVTLAGLWFGGKLGLRHKARKGAAP